MPGLNPFDGLLFLAVTGTLGGWRRVPVRLH